MTFNEGARLDPSGVQKRSGGRGRTGATLGGGSIIVVVIAFFVSQLLGVDVTGLLSGGATSDGGVSGESGTFEECQSGAAANTDVNCRMVGAQNSLDAYWSAQAEAQGFTYRTPGFVIYENETGSACGTASNAVGPFYCPADNSIYVDVSFFDILQQQYGSSGGPLAQLYVIAHEWGHHLQYELGILQQVGQGSGPDSDAVRLELQADCFAGAWVGQAATTTDADGVQLLQAPSEQELRDALSAAAAVGDDHIQSSQGGSVQPEAFTHGTSEQRMRWFATGYQQGWQVCDTFAVDGSRL